MKETIHDIIHALMGLAVTWQFYRARIARMTPPPRLVRWASTGQDTKSRLLQRLVVLQGPTCGACGLPMRHNVPGLGDAGGWVHAYSGQFSCEPESKPSPQIYPEKP
jgi:hypothetical protein